MNEEIFDVVDADDNVIGQASRREVHARHLLHRAANVFVFTTDGKLLVQKRSGQKDEYPHCYTSSASGHLNAGEDYAPCAARELEEELGLTAPLERLHKFRGGPHNAYEHTVLYRTRTDQQPRINTDEIESIHYFDLTELAALIDRHPEEFTPPFRQLFSWYIEHA